MNQFIRWMLVLVTVSSFSFAGFSAEQRTTLTIKSDGSCTVVIDKTESRALVEQQMRMWERYQKNSQGLEDDSAPAAAPKDPQPLTDDELVKKIREIAKATAEQMGQEDADKIDLLEVKSNTVHSVTTKQFSNLEEMLKQSYAVLVQSGFVFENVKIDNDAEGHLRVALTPSPGMQRYAKNLRQQWKLTGAVSEFRLVFPGKVVTSGLPQTAENATWIAIDAQKNETMDAAMKLYEGPILIIAEAGGLKLERPLESKTLQRQSRRGGMDPALPITDAGPGFVAEPMAVVTTTLYYFPGGEKQLKQAGSFGRQPTGTVVHAKLFAPKGRTLQFVSGVRVLKATDDKGREIAGSPANDEVAENSYSYNPGSQQGNSTRIQLHLPLPAPDAQSIDELSGEAITVTAGKWREITLTNVNESFTNEVDLAEVLPGAKLIFSKFKSKNRQTAVQAQIKGPPAIRQIEIQTKASGERRGNSHTSENKFTTREGQATRIVQFQSYDSNNEDGPSGPLSLVVRYPEDQRRERVRFALKGLDLF